METVVAALALEGLFLFFLSHSALFCWSLTCFVNMFPGSRQLKFS